MARRLTTFSKLLIVLLVLLALFFGGQWILNNTSVGQDLKEKAEQQAEDARAEKENSSSTNNNSSSESKTNSGNKKDGLFSKSGRTDDGKTLRVQLVTWPGYAPGLYFNEGADANTRSRYFKDYGFKVEFSLEDDLINAMNAWLAGEYDIIVQTADAFPIYTSIGDVNAVEPRVFMQTDWSRGGDAIIAKRGINSINDLKGKTIVLAVPAPAQTLLITALESAGMSLDDVKIRKVTDNIIAAESFLDKDVDAAVVWSPFDQEAISQVPGSKVLINTESQSHIIGDIFFAKEDVIKSKRDMFNGFYEGWMKAVAEMKTPSNYEKAAKYLGDFLKVSADDAKVAMSTVYYTGHGDNMNFFGLNSKHRGMRGGDLYDKMNKKFADMGDTEGLGPNWRNVINTTAVLEADRTLKGAAYAAEGAKVFTAPTAKERTAPALASKPISISFNTGQYQLSENAKTIIDIQFAETAKSFGNMRVRIEGNTDNVGARAMNQKLSEQRARSVAKYLQTTYGMDANRFVIIGNGPDKPVPGCESNATTACKAKNRRTDFQLIAG